MIPDCITYTDYRYVQITNLLKFPHEIIICAPFYRPMCPKRINLRFSFPGIQRDIFMFALQTIMSKTIYKYVLSSLLNQLMSCTCVIIHIILVSGSLFTIYLDLLNTYISQPYICYTTSISSYQRIS